MRITFHYIHNITRIRHSLALIMALLLLPACGDKTDNEPSPSVARVTLLTSIGGPGDNGYNDLITDAVMKFYEAHPDVTLLLRHPKDLTEAREMTVRWREDSDNDKIPSLLVMASDSYLQICRETLTGLPENCDVLLFETPHDDLPDQVHTFKIGRYGVSCLAGLMASESPEAHIIAACPSDPLLTDAIEGFTAGYSSRNHESIIETHYLADDDIGYEKAADAYLLASRLDRECFIFPLAGGSNGGVFKYTRESLFTPLLVAGMDVDCSKLSTRVPFSVITGIDKILLERLATWLQTGDMPLHSDYNLGNSDFTHIEINDGFLRNANIFLDYYSDDHYWRRLHDSLIQKAIEMERIYYGK